MRTKVLVMLAAEINIVMGQMGAPSIADIGPKHVGLQNRTNIEWPVERLLFTRKQPVE